MQYSNFNASGSIKASSCLNDSSCLNASRCIYASRCLNTSSCLNASGCMNGSGCLNAGGSTDVFQTIALIISGRPRVPIVCAERIIVSEAQVQQLPISGGNFAVRINQTLQTLFLLDFLSEIMKVNKIIHQCLSPSQCNFGSDTTLISIYFGLQSRANSDR